MTEMSESVAKFKEFQNDSSLPSQAMYCAAKKSESKVNEIPETNGAVGISDLTAPDLTKAIVPISTTLPSKILRLQLQQRQQSLQHQTVIAISQNGEHVYTINDHRDLIDLSNSGDSTGSVSEEEDELKPLPKEHINQVQAPVLNEITNDYYNHNIHNHHHHHHHPLQQQHYPQNDQMQRRDSFEGTFEQAMQVKTYQPVTSSDNLDNEFRSQVSEIDTLDPSEIPDDKLSEEIVEQVEYYFSNESILKDAFLLKHVRRNKEGFVSLKLVSSFKRVRQLTKDWKVVGHAVRRHGKLVELNDECSKVRRIDPLPNFDETMPSRTIVVCDLPLDKLTIEKVSDIFSKCGEIALIRILKPGMAIPIDVRQFMNKYPEMQQKECALVEYVDSASARNAKNLQGNFQVYDMVAPKKKTGKKAAVTAPVSKMVDNYKNFNFERARGGSFSGNIPSSETDLRFKLRRNHSDFHMKTENLHHHTHSYNHHVQQQQQPQHFVHHALSHCHNLARTNSIENGSAGGNTGPTNMNFYASSPRRFNGITEIMNSPRRYSNCSTDGYSTCSEISRRPSNCSIEGVDIRRDLGCSENCPCLNSRRGSQNTEPYRKLSHESDSDCSQRRFSNGSFQFERTFSNANDMVVMPRRQSNDFNFTRKPSAEMNSGIMMENENFHTYRRFSNNFDPKSKMAGYELYNGRRISTDSGYDRRYSFGSDFEGSPRSRTGSFLNSYKNASMGEFDGSPRSRTGSFLSAIHKAENVVRTPMGPDGSKGFGTRARKFGQIVAPVN